MVAGMVPGLLIGLQRTTAIDYDAVAYRTGAILAEDPGWPVFPAWELSNNADGVDRIGLAVAKESPNILSSAKIAKFSDSTLFTNSEEYRKRIIFGDYPYRFNIMLKNETGDIFPPIGDPIPGLGSYGYIQRVVKIKQESNATIDFFDPDHNASTFDEYEITDVNETPQNFTIRLNVSELVDKSINPAYQFNP
ncbi:MAG: hypothetical protein LUP99_00995, partial [Methanomicrobiales archaeon]|nr:hypothetical protein [Methanomicrobiales archaeon]